MKIKAIIIIAVILQSFKAQGQAPPEEFFTGIKLFATDKAEAKKNFLTAYQKAPEYFGTSNFLGMIYQSEHKPDSAIAYYKKSMLLNVTNINHTREFTCAHLIDLYTYQHDFNNAFNAAWEACKLYPDNREILTELKDVCLWSFYIKYNGLSADYLSPDAKDDYVVNSILEEYLVARKIRIGDNGVNITSQALSNKNGASYDVLTCSTAKNDQKVTLNFRINWDMGKDFGGKVAHTQPVINDTKAPVYERVGAALVANRQADVKTEIEKLLK